MDFRFALFAAVLALPLSCGVAEVTESGHPRLEELDPGQPPPEFSTVDGVALPDGHRALVPQDDAVYGTSPDGEATASAQQRLSAVSGPTVCVLNGSLLSDAAARQLIGNTAYHLGVASRAVQRAYYWSYDSDPGGTKTAGGQSSTYRILSANIGVSQSPDTYTFTATLTGRYLPPMQMGGTAYRCWRATVTATKTHAIDSTWTEVSTFVEPPETDSYGKKVYVVRRAKYAAYGSSQMQMKEYPEYGYAYGNRNLWEIFEPVDYADHLDGALNLRGSPRISARGSNLSTLSTTPVVVVENFPKGYVCPDCSTYAAQYTQALMQREYAKNMLPVAALCQAVPAARLFALAPPCQAWKSLPGNVFGGAVLDWYSAQQALGAAGSPYRACTDLRDTCKRCQANPLSCTGKQCGTIQNACGSITCGTCSSPQVCNPSTYQCGSPPPTNCALYCATHGYECGQHEGCNCGTCGSGYTCGDSNRHCLPSGGSCSGGCPATTCTACGCNEHRSCTSYSCVNGSCKATTYTQTCAVDKGSCSCFNYSVASNSCKCGASASCTSGYTCACK